MIFAMGQFSRITYQTITFKQKVVIGWGQIYSEARNDKVPFKN